MNVRTNIYFLLLIIFVGVSCTKVEKVFHKNGKLKQEIHLKSGEKNGPSIWYYDNGSKEIEFMYKDGKLEGPSYRWNINGKLISEDTYVKGVKNGISRIYDKNGQLEIQQTYTSNILNGKYEVFYSDIGKIKISGYYKAGMFDGIWEFFDEYGRKIGEGNFKEGNGSIRSFYSNGTVKNEQKYKNNQKFGELLTFDSETHNSN